MGKLNDIKNREQFAQDLSQAIYALVREYFGPKARIYFRMDSVILGKEGFSRMGWTNSNHATELIDVVDKQDLKGFTVALAKCAMEVAEENGDTEMVEKCKKDIELILETQPEETGESWESIFPKGA